MLELKILIDDVDYNSLTELLVPLLAEKLEKDGRGGILGGILAGNQDMAVGMARTLLNTMPQEKKDELAVQLLTRNRDKLLQKGRELAAKNGGRLQLCDIAAKKIERRAPQSGGASLYTLTFSGPARRRGGRPRSPAWWPSWRRTAHRSESRPLAPNTRSRSACRSRPAHRRA